MLILEEVCLIWWLVGVLPAYPLIGLGLEVMQRVFLGEVLDTLVPKDWSFASTTLLGVVFIPLKHLKLCLMVLIFDG